MARTEVGAPYQISLSGRMLCSTATDFLRAEVCLAKRQRRTAERTRVLLLTPGAKTRLFRRQLNTRGGPTPALCAAHDAALSACGAKLSLACDRQFGNRTMCIELGPNHWSGALEYASPATARSPLRGRLSSGAGAFLKAPAGMSQASQKKGHPASRGGAQKSPREGRKAPRESQ